MSNRIITNPTMAEWRSEMGISQREAAEALGCSRTSIATWEQNPDGMPHYITLAMRALGMSNWADVERHRPSEFDKVPGCLTE